MDAVGLEILLREIQADVAVMAEAAQRAKLRLTERSPGFLEAAAFDLGRHYNVMERVFERVCDAFENQFERRGDYHEKLLQRMALSLPGIRPALVPNAALPDLRELKGFRHVVRHAYDLTLREDRIQELVNMVVRITQDLPQWVDQFGRTVREEQGWSG